MSKKNAHEEIEKIKADYLLAYRMRWGDVKANLLKITYRKGWFYLTSSLLSTPYRASEMRAMTEILRRKTK